MKKLIITLCLCLSCCILFSSSIQANEFYYEEIIEEIYLTNSTRASQSKTAKKTANIKNSSGVILWSVTVIGTFTYTGTNAICTNSTVSAKSNDSRWKITSQSSSKSENKASATTSAKYYLDGVEISSLKKTVTLTCSPTGVLS